MSLADYSARMIHMNYKWPGSYSIIINWGNKLISFIFISTKTKTF